MNVKMPQFTPEWMNTAYLLRMDTIYLFYGRVVIEVIFEYNRTL